MQIKRELHETLDINGKFWAEVTQAAFTGNKQVSFRPNKGVTLIALTENELGSLVNWLEGKEV